MLEISYVAAILSAVAVSSIIAVLSYLLVYKRLLNAPHITSFIAAIGLLMLLEGIAMAVSARDTSAFTHPSTTWLLLVP